MLLGRARLIRMLRCNRQGLVLTSGELVSAGQAAGGGGCMPGDASWQRARQLPSFVSPLGDEMFHMIWVGDGLLNESPCRAILPNERCSAPPLGRRSPALRSAHAAARREAPGTSRLG